ncbi:MAG: hypothetical protein WD750_08070 [Gammaproteobacteria bacterium]
MKFISDIIARIDDLSVRERAAVFIAIIAVIFFIWDSYLMSTLDNRERTLKAQIQQKQSEQAALNAELQILIAGRQEDPNRENREKLASLRTEMDEVKAEVMKSTKHLISPNKMAVVLENVLNKTRGLELVEVKGLGSSTLVAADKKTVKDAGGNESSANADKETEGNGELANAYKHGLRVVFNGSFMATLDYIRELEALDNEFIWDNLKFEIIEYPDGQVSITVFTLSLDRNWIGA